MAAGTLKMTLMIAFRFNRMNTTASKLEKNLCVYAHVPVSGDLAYRTRPGLTRARRAGEGRTQ